MTVPSSLRIFESARTVKRRDLSCGEKERFVKKRCGRMSVGSWENRRGNLMEIDRDGA